MNCKKIRQSIITDYLDGEMAGREKTRVEEHMARCPECKKFYMTAKKATDEVFLNVKSVNPPEYVWRRIKENILAGKERKRNFVPDIFGKLRTFLYIPKPALAIISMLIIVLAIGTIAHFRSDRAISEQMDYFNYLTSSSADVSNNNGAGFGTTIEKYFM